MAPGCSLAHGLLVKSFLREDRSLENLLQHESFCPLRDVSRGPLGHRQPASGGWRPLGPGFGPVFRAKTRATANPCVAVRSVFSLHSARAADVQHLPRLRDPPPPRAFLPPEERDVQHACGLESQASGEREPGRRRLRSPADGRPPRRFRPADGQPGLSRSLLRRR